MDRSPSPNDPTQYLENLMHAGQQSIKQFDDALAATMGVRRNNAAPTGPGLFTVCVRDGYAARLLHAILAVLERCLHRGNHRREARGGSAGTRR